MQTTSVTMLAALDAHESGGQSFDLIELVEVYAADYQPDATNGYEPADAEKRWGGVLGYTFTGLAYEREYVDRSDIQKFVGRSENNVTLNFSNISREMATWVQENDIEGMQVVIRVVSRATSAVLADSLVIFTGRLDRPGDFSDTAGSLSATQRFGRINQQFPPRTFSPNDPQGRAPNDPLFEGFRFSAQAATILWTTRERRQGFGGLVGLTKKVGHSFQASSHSGATADLAVPDGFGKVQFYGTYLATIDIGGAINFAVAVCEGGEEGIDSYVAVKQVNPKFSQVLGFNERWGYRGGEGPVGRVQTPPVEPYSPGRAYYSRLAHFYGFVTGSTPDEDEAEAPDFMILIKAKRVMVPDGAGDFSSRAWTDNPAYIARHLLADERYFNEGESSINDAQAYETGQYCAGYVLDPTKGEWVMIPETDAGLHGIDFFRYRSTSLIDARRVRMNELATLAGDPQATLAEIEPFDPSDPPGPFDTPTNPNLRQTVLRQRHACNVTLLERMSALDFLHNVVAPTGRLFFRRNGKGQTDILTEKPADNTRLRGAAVATNTTVKVTDVDPWKAGLLLTQKLLIGNTLTTSEVRTVTAAAYTADGNAITLAAAGSGGMTATAGGATLAGGSSSTPASRTVTLSGTPGAGAVITVTINGISCQYTLDSYDSLDSAAILLARFINATPRLAQFVKASVAGAVVTITAKWGVLTLNTALANSHAAEVASPTTAPTGAGAAAGVLAAGVYYVAYARRSALGLTAISPVVAVTVAAGQKIVTGAVTPLPAGAVSVDWFVSTYADSTELVYYGNNDGSAFTIGQTDAPDSAEDLPPDMNTSGEELVRVAMSFASNDQGAAVLAQTGLTRGSIHKGTFKWPVTSKQSSVNLVTGTFYDATEDYQPTPLEVRDYGHIAQTRKENKKECDLSGFDNYHQASRYLNFILSKNREGDWFATKSAGPRAMLLEEGDVICSSSDNGGLVNVTTRAEEISIGKAPQYTVKVTGRKYSTLMFSDRVRQHTIRLPTVRRHVTPLATEIQLLDIPFWRERDAAAGPGILVAVRRAAGLGSWKGTAIWLDLGDGYKEVLPLDVEAVTGESLTTLTDHAAGLDTTNTVRVRLDNTADVLTTATADELRAGANLFRLEGEIFQARDCALVGGTEADYDLSYLYRGLYGTENETATHATGDGFTVLDGKVFHLSIDASHVGAEIGVKAVTVNQDVADATEHLFTWEGKSQKPLPIARVETEEDEAVAPRDAAGNIYLGVWPRTNLAGLGDRYRYTPLEDDGTEIADAFEYFREDQPQPALLVSYVPGTSGKYQSVTASVSGNAFSFSGGGTASGRARSSQKIRQEGNFAEATLRGAADCTVSFGLVAAGKDWRTASFDYRFILSSAGGGDGLDIYEGATLLYTENASAYVAAGKRFRFRLLGGKVQFFKDYVDDSTPPLAESVVAPNFPLRVVMSVGISGGAGAGYVENVILTTNPLPGVIVTVAQQTAWYGGLKNPMRVRIEQDSGLRTVGWGQPWEGEI